MDLDSRVVLGNVLCDLLVVADIMEAEELVEILAILDKIGYLFKHSESVIGEMHDQNLKDFLQVLGKIVALFILAILEYLLEVAKMNVLLVHDWCLELFLLWLDGRWFRFILLSRLGFLKRLFLFGRFRFLFFLRRCFF